MASDVDLRSTLLRSAAEVVARSGVGEVSIRELARQAGVSHAAHRYHFASRTGLLTALAAEGHRLLADRLEEAARVSFLEVGVAYVRFARDHPGHFAVMFTPDVLDAADAELAAATPLPDNAYKLPMARNVVVRTLLELTERTA